MRIVVDWSLCDGNGLCAKEAPQLLSLDADDQLHILKEDLAEEDLAPAERAVAVCPKSALKIE
jgi:ferredoxin